MAVNYQVEKYGSGMRINVAAMPGWFPELSHVEMVQQVAAYGFRSFEALSAGKWTDKAEVKAACIDLGVVPGCISGSGSITGDGPVNLSFHRKFELDIRNAIQEAQALGTKCLCGTVGAAIERLSPERQADNLVPAGRRVAPMLEDAGITLNFEPLNIRTNHHGYFLVYTEQAADIIERIGSPNVKILYDVYHQQISEGNIIPNIKRFASTIGHYHIGDNPGRHEPGTGELNFRRIFQAIAETGYTGVVASEFSLSEGCTTDQVMRVLAEAATW